jgi:membrane fusion protein, multidrug efflux system
MRNRIAAGALAGLLLPLLLLPFAAGAAPIQAEVVTLRTRPIPIDATFPGTVVPSEYVQVASRMSGYVSGLRVDVGQSVKKDELLLTVNPAEVDADIQQAGSQLTEAEAALATAEENYKRFKNLFAQGAVPKQRFQEVKLAYEAAKSDVTTAKAGVDKARNQVGYSELRAPFDGVIFSKKVSNGQLVSPGQELLVLYDPAQLQVKVQVDDSAYHQLRKGEKVPVQYGGGDRRPQQVEASVESLVAAVDPVTHTHTVKLVLPADAGAEGGEYARVMIPVEQSPVLLVPRSAVHQRAGITGVFVVDRDGQARFRMVTLGERRGEDRVVLSGLFSADRLILSAKGELANGVQVRGDGP